MDFILESIMGSEINTKVGFSFDNGVLKSIIVGMDGVKKSVFGASESVVKLNKKLGDLSKIQGLSSLSTVISNSVGGLKSLVGYAEKLTSFFSSYADRGDKIAKTSRLVGMSVKDYQDLGYAAGMSGISMEELDASLIKFNNNLAKARSGDKSAKKMFDSILPKKSKLSDYKNGIDVLKAVSDGYTKIKKSEEKAYASQELFGKSGVKMTELLSMGSAALAESMKESPEGFSEEGTKAAEKFGDALSGMKLKLDGMVVTVAQDLFPVFTELFDSVSSFVNNNRDTITKQLKEIGFIVSEFVKDLLPRIPKILDTVVRLVDSIGPGWVAALTAVVAMLPALSQIVIGMVALKPVVFGTVGFVFGAISHIKTVIWAIVTALKITAAVLGGPVVATIGLIVAAVVSWGVVIHEIYEKWEFVKVILGDVWNLIKGIGKHALNFFAALPDVFGRAWEGFKNGISMVGKFIYDSFFGAISGAINAAKGLLSSLPLVGSLFSDSSGSASNSVSSAAASVSAPNSVSSAAASVIQQSSVTTTNRFAVDFGNVPQGTKITPPSSGDFDWSRSYTLAGAV